MRRSPTSEKLDAASWGVRPLSSTPSKLRSVLETSSWYGLKDRNGDSEDGAFGVDMRWAMGRRCLAMDVPRPLVLVSL